VLEAKVVIDEWLELYNTRRPHRGLAGQTPAAYAKMVRSRANVDLVGGRRVRVPAAAESGPVLQLQKGLSKSTDRRPNSHTKWTKCRGPHIRISTGAVQIFVAWQFPTHGDALPHDLCHFVCRSRPRHDERLLGLIDQASTSSWSTTKPPTPAVANRWTDPRSTSWV